MPPLVFDIGGTRTRAALVDPVRAAVIRSISAPTPNHLDHPEASFEELRDRLLSLMQRLAAELMGNEPVHRVDVAFAGPIAPDGAVLGAPTVWGARAPPRYRLSEDLARVWSGARVNILNDVTAAGYRYLRARDEDFCIFTVSSGIGHKVFLGGRPVLGRNGSGGELGHVQFDDSRDAPLCECGGRGHLGALSSGRGVLAHARRHAPHGINSETLTCGDLVAAFHRGEDWAEELIAHGARPLGFALASMHLALGLERFVLFGGFALALGEKYRKQVADAARSRCWRTPGDWDARVELGINDDASGLVGAAIAGTLEEGTA